MKDHIKYLDGWRGLAIVFVLVGHFFPTPWINLGPFGVEMFFVLSGRLMADILFERKINLSTFFARRISRIFPALLFFCSTLFILSILLRFLNKSSDILVQIDDFIAAVFLVSNYGSAFFNLSSVLEHIWSLSVEEHSYILLAGIAFITQRNPRRACHLAGTIAAIMMISGVCQYLVFSPSEHDLYWRSDVRAASILGSFSFFLWILVTNKTFSIHSNKWTPLVAFALGLALNFEAVPLWIKYSFGTVCLIVSLNSLSYAPTIIRRTLGLRPLVLIGTLSYSIYLWQQPFYFGISFFGPVLALIGALLFGCASFWLIEQPSRRFLNQKWDQMALITSRLKAVS